MKMVGLEKRFVNRPAHAEGVARAAVALLARIETGPAWRYLDVGCGVGSAARAIAERGDLDVTAVDVDPAQIAAAQAAATRMNLHFLTMDATALQFNDAEFDIVASSMATHHIPNWRRAMSEMARVLRSGGYLIYVDLMFPRWLAAIGRWVPVMGFPSLSGLMAIAERAKLTSEYRSRRGPRLQAIFRKAT